MSNDIYNFGFVGKIKVGGRDLGVISKYKSGWCYLGKWVDKEEIGIEIKF